MPCSDLVASVEAFFAPQGPLAKAMPGFEIRDEQRVFAARVAQAMADGRPLLAEAGTGIGKTLGYLVPAVLSGKRTLISTATRALQSQMLREDIPTLERALGASLGAVTLKGRTNYLCEMRADTLLRQTSLEPHRDQRLSEIAAWRRRTDTGDCDEVASISSNTDPLWRRLTATSDQCLGRRCAHYESCWLLRARKRAEEAPVTICNHHLFFADAALRLRQPADAQAPVALLPTVERMVFDEAHELDEVAAAQFGTSTSCMQLETLLAEVGGVATEAGNDRAHGMAHACLAVVQAAFGELHVAPKGPAPFSLTAHTAARQAAAEACERMQLLAAHLNDGNEPFCQSSEARFFGRRLHMAADSCAAAFAAFEGPDDEHMVRWVEARDNDRQVIARPLDVAGALQGALTRAPGVFVSATLRIGGQFSHIQERLGLTDIETCCVDSPYDWSKAAALYVPGHLPSPGVDVTLGMQAELAADFVVASQGGAFVLCTSHRVLPVMQRAIRARFDGTLLMQSQGSKEGLLKRFADDGNAVLVATNTFWRGVDVRGSALRLVIIDRIPFAPPTDPYVEARMAHAKRQGKDGFRHIQLPQAALQLRQGIGRLLRGSQDAGVVALLDSRLARKGFGRWLLKSLPEGLPELSYEQTLQRLRDNAAKAARTRSGATAPADEADESLPF